jgi:DNA-binding IclR family transcriptional regulator
MDEQDIDKILDALKNGRSHALKELTQETGIKEPKTRLIIAFLEKFQFVEVGKDGNIKLNRLTKQFLDKLDKTDPSVVREDSVRVTPMK